MKNDYCQMQRMQKGTDNTSKVQFCGCPNQMRVVDDKVGANDLSKVVMVSNNVEKKRQCSFSIKILRIKKEKKEKGS